MELQWPLILFTALLAWSAGTFATQGVYALRGRAPEVQKPALACSFVLLVAGGIAVFFHLQHWERIFNGFGHITSGITQELIAIIAMVAVMVVFFVMLRRGKVSGWAGVLAVVVSLALCVVMSASYMMSSRPAWNTVLWLLVIVGNACVLGPATVAFLAGDDADGPLVLVGSVVNAVAALAYTAFLGAAGGGTGQLEFYYDLTHPTKDIEPVGSVLGANPLLVWLGVVAIGVILPVVFAWLGKKNLNWKTWGAAVAVAAFVGALCIRVAFYHAGSSVFMYY